MTDMTLQSNPSTADHTPAWVNQLRGILAEREHAASEPAPQPDIPHVLAEQAARHWLSRAGASAGKRLSAQLGNQPGVRLTWALSSGVDPVPSLTVTVWAGKAELFTYVLKLPVSAGACHPKVSARGGSGASIEEAFRPWVTSGGALEAIGPDDVAGDITRVFAELAPA